MKGLLSLPDFQLLTIENNPANVPGKLIPLPESSQCASSPAHWSTHLVCSITFLVIRKAGFLSR